jgi:hypothetical protein
MENYRPISGYGLGYDTTGPSIIKLVEDRTGLRIFFETKTDDGYALRFSDVLQFRYGSEITRLKTLRNLEDSDTGLVNIVENSEFISWFHIESNSIYENQRIVHYCIITCDDIVDILTRFPPDLINGIKSFKGFE